MDWGSFILTEGDYLLRVIVAALCGLAIGSDWVRVQIRLF